MNLLVKTQTENIKTMSRRKLRGHPEQHHATEGPLHLCCTVTLQKALLHWYKQAAHPCVQRLAYFPQEAAKELSKYSLLVTVDARLPVAMFGYK